MLKNYQVLIFLFWTLFSVAQTPQVTEESIPDWVEVTPPNYDAAIAEEATGFYFLMVDNQDNLLTEERYRRRTYSILNTDGLGDMADFSVDFDAEYSRLSLHFINIIRDGKVIQQLDLDRLRLFQPEKNSDNNIYDKSFRALLYLQDLRVNDIVDYAYTLQGNNPIYEGKYTGDFYLEYQIPAYELKLKVNVPQEEQIATKSHRGAQEPSVHEGPRYTTYTWHTKNPEVIQYEENTPAWYETEKFVELSQFKNWKAVNDQFKKHYQFTDAQRARLKKEFLSHTELDPSDKFFIEKLIRFVQDDVRYLGLEDGLNSHLPSDPSAVLKRKYGDCKDKSFLLSELLKAFNHQAQPVLVHTLHGKNIQDRLASPDLFNHCVVQLSIPNEEVIYIDPTMTNQGGKLNNIYFPDYDYGLVLTDTTTALTALPEPKQSKMEFKETYTVNNVGKSGNAYLEVISEYHGNSADYKRQEFSNNSLSNIQKSYTDFYSLLYQNISPEITLKYDDNRLKNTFTTKEYYKIDSLWQAEKESSELYAEFYPLVLESYLSSSANPGREMPYAFANKTAINYNLVVHTPEPWSIKNTAFDIRHPAFSYNSTVDYASSRLDILHTYEINETYVSAEDFASFITKQDEILANLSYILTYNTAFLDSGEKAESNYSMWAILITLLSLIGAGIGCIKIYRHYDLPPKVAPQWHRPLGGWLILVLIGLFITPFRILHDIFTGLFYNVHSWHFLFNNETGNFFGGLLIIFELIFNWCSVIFSILLIVLFLKRRTILPRLLIIFYAVNFIVQIADNYLVMQIFDQTYNDFELQQLYTQIFVSFVSICIWIPYFLFSERVKDTFTKMRKPINEEESALTEGEEQTRETLSVNS